MNKHVYDKCERRFSARETTAGRKEDRMGVQLPQRPNGGSLFLMQIRFGTPKPPLIYRIGLFLNSSGLYPPAIKE